MNYPKYENESWTEYLERCNRYEEEEQDLADQEVQERLIERNF